MTAERSVFKLLLAGVDDSALAPVQDARTFKTSTGAKIELVEEMTQAVRDELSANFPDFEQLPEQREALKQTFAQVQNEAQLAQESIREYLGQKRLLATKISAHHARVAEIQITLGRFEQLQEVYESDIQRLEAIEEAGFHLLLGASQDCPVCGAPPNAQLHEHGLSDVERAREAAVAEIRKIAVQRTDLGTAIEQLTFEGLTASHQLADLDRQLQEVETRLQDLAPSANQAQRRLEDILQIRDHVRLGMSLLDQLRTLSLRREQLSRLKPASKGERPKLGVPTGVAHDFAQTVSEVLREWQFPGKRQVFFDENSYDLVIDGKQRNFNGKGVRAITHAAFKVALLVYCQDRNLPHPGFLILDTPLLTYRDPLKSRAGELAADEEFLRNTSLKDHFFEYLSARSKLAQFIVLENVDSPAGIEELASVQAFTGEPNEGRGGLFPTRPRA